MTFVTSRIRMRRVSVTALAAVILTLAATPAVAQTTGVLAGTVIAKDTGSPVTAATVKVEGSNQAVVTNALGRFRLQGLPAGRVTLTVSGPGFLDLRIPDIQAGADAPALVIELVATPNILERVQVTATKSALSIGDVAAQTDVVTRSTMDDRNE